MLHSGILLTRVFTSRGQLPVENAAVSVVLHSDSDRHTLLNIQTSDRSGNTLPTTIETPGVQNSQFPGQEAPCYPVRHLGRAQRIPTAYDSKRTDIPRYHQHPRSPPPPHD